VIASASGTGEAVVVAEIDPAAVKAARDKVPNLRNGRAFTLETVAASAKGGVAA
jgi:predicted amidohydrolase